MFGLDTRLRNDNRLVWHARAYGSRSRLFVIDLCSRNTASSNLNGAVTVWQDFNILLSCLTNVLAAKIEVGLSFLIPPCFWSRSWRDTLASRSLGNGADGNCRSWTDTSGSEGVVNARHGQTTASQKCNQLVARVGDGFESNSHGIRFF
jgi:hypothetical protein